MSGEDSHQLGGDDQSKRARPLCYFEHWLARFHEQQRNKWAIVGAGLVPAQNYKGNYKVAPYLMHPSIMSESPSL